MQTPSKTKSGFLDNIFKGSVFWYLILVFTLGGLAYLSVWSLINNNLRVFIISAIFFFFTLTGIVLSRFEIFTYGNFSRNSLALVIGFLIYSMIASSTKNVASTFSVLSITSNSLLATVAGQLPLNIDFLTSSIIIPIAEEVFWIFGLTLPIVGIMRLFGRDHKLFGKVWFQILVASAISGISFAFFHAGKSGVAFIASAILFRLVMTTIMVGDVSSNIIPFVTLGFSFSIGAHIGNNWAIFGLGRGFSLLWDNIFSYGGIVYLIIIAIIVGSLWEIGKLVNDRNYRRMTV